MELLAWMLLIVPYGEEQRPVEVDCIEINVAYDGREGGELYRAMLLWDQIGPDEHRVLGWNYLEDVRIWRENGRWRASWSQWSYDRTKRYEIVSDELIAVASIYDRALHDPTYCCYSCTCACRLLSVEDGRKLVRRVGGAP